MPASQDLAKEVEKQSKFVHKIREQVAKIIVGQRTMMDRLLIGLIADGHVLLEGVPGLAKTTAVKTVAQALKTGFSRIQFTPDLLPADLVGTEIYRPASGEFAVKQGPIFTNLLLADEINRAPAKVQSALLEAMQERQVTIADQTFELPKPFLVMATQNPIEQEGTYPLPEAQVDRFMLKLKIDYPNKTEEKQILKTMCARTLPVVEPVTNPEELMQARELCDALFIDPKVEDYIVDLIFATREPKLYGLEKLADLIEYGASPRATIYLAQAAKVCAFLDSRAYVTPQDVKNIAPDVLRHRVLLTYEAEAQDLTSDDVVEQILGSVDVP